MNAPTESKATSEKIDVKVKIKQLFDIVESTNEIVTALGDHELVAMRDALGQFSMVDGPKAGFNYEFVFRLLRGEMDDRWEKEHARLTASSPLYRLYYKDDNIPF